MEHRNNPITNSERISTSSWGIRLDGTSLGSLAGRSMRRRTSAPVRTALTTSSTLTSTVSDSTLTVAGIEYNLIIKGFTKQRGGLRDLSGRFDSDHVADRRGPDQLRLPVGELRQVRPLTILKVGIGAANPPEFAFTSTSTRTGSFWKTSPWTLDPTAAGLGGAAARSDVIYAGNETVTVTEGDLPAGWSFTNVSCVDSLGNSVGTVSQQDRDPGESRRRARRSEGDRLHVHERPVTRVLQDHEVGDQPGRRRPCRQPSRARTTAAPATPATSASRPGSPDGQRHPDRQHLLGRRDRTRAASRATPGVRSPTPRRRSS